MNKLVNWLLAVAAMVTVTGVVIAQQERGDEPRRERAEREEADRGERERGDRERGERGERERGEQADRQRGRRDGDRARGDRDQDRPRRDRGRAERGERGLSGPGPIMPLVAALDKNGDGEISTEEIEQAPAALRQLDRNNDGQLTRGELMLVGPPDRRGPAGEFGRRRPRDGEGPPNRRGERPRFSPEAMVARLMQQDADDDGNISPDEASERMKRGFDRIDENSDGFLEKSEIKEFVQQMATRMREQRREGFDRRDRGPRDREGRPGADRDRRPRRERDANRERERERERETDRERQQDGDREQPGAEESDEG